MELARVLTDKGSINISRATIETLTRLILQDINGIIHLKRTSLRRRTALLTENGDKENNNVAQEVRVEIKPDTIIINLYLIIQYGIKIPDLTWEVQTKIKEKLKKVTNLEIEQIDVHIQGIRFSKKYHNRGTLVAPGTFLKIF